MSKIKWQNQLLSSLVSSIHWFLSLSVHDLGISHPLCISIIIIIIIIILSIIGHKTCRYRRLSINVIVVLLAIILSNLYKDKKKYSLELEQYINDFYDGQAKHNSKLHSSRSVSSKGLRYINGKWMTRNSQIIRFRGVNLPAKTPSSPTNLVDTRDPNQFYESKQHVSFINRPFSLDEAPSHFQRLSQHWGFNVIRLSVTWEAVMHNCPGCVDTQYLVYLKELVEMAEGYGLYVIIDPHQDVWSRLTGGDGAPWWTLDAAGFDTSTSALHDTGSAVLHQHWTDGEMPKMLWTTNYWKLAAATMFTLFFGGNDYAPGITALNTTIPIQEFLQGHYLDFIDIVARTVKDCPNVLGFGTMNEPSNGFIGVKDLTEVHSPTLHGHVLSGFDSMRLGSGEPLTVSYFPSHFYHGSPAILNPSSQIAYKSSNFDVWRRAGVYEIDETSGTRILLHPHYFSLAPGETFETKYMRLFYTKVQRVVEHNNPDFVTYAEPYFDTATVDRYPKAPAFDKSSNAKVGFAPHWYDAMTLFIGHYNSFLFSGFIDWLFRNNLFEIKNGAHNMHVLIGETGVPFFGSRKDYAMSLDRTLTAMETNDLDYTLWCYESKNKPTIGDLWNGEDLSLYSNGKGRGLQAALRPFPYQYSNGLEVSSQRFRSFSGAYELVLHDHVHCEDCTATVFLFAPSCRYSRGVMFTVSAGELYHDIESQNIEWKFARTKKHYSLTISAAGSN
jgi:hypothetical protein